MTGTTDSQAPFALVVDSWFDGEHYRNQATTVQVKQGKITAIDSGDHSAALQQQGMAVSRGKFLMPGLVDAHVHLFIDGAPLDFAERSAHLKRPLEELTDTARRLARQCLAHGITLVRDAGDKHGINNQVRDEAQIPGSDLPGIRSGGMGVRRPKRYGAFMAREVDNDREMIEAMDELCTVNDDIKIILTGIIDFDAGTVTDEPQFTVDETRLMVEQARKQGRKTFAHCSGLKGLEIAAAAGVGSIEHGFFMTRDILTQMRDNNVAWTPTFCPVHFQYAHPEAAGWSAQTVDNLKRILDQHAEHLLLAHEMGVPLLLGTDAGSMGVVHGQSLYEEMERYLAAGLPMDAVLRAGTATARRHFDAPHVLQEPGADFDACLSDEDPFITGKLSCPQQIWHRGIAVNT